LKFEEGEVDMSRKDMTTTNTKLVLSLVAVTFVAITMFAAEAKGQTEQESQVELTAPLEPLRPDISVDRLFAELDAHNEIRKFGLRDYTALRTYQVIDLKGKVHAEEIGRMEFRAPDKKTFVVTSERGSGLIRRMALNPLISSEIEAAAGKEHHDSAISPENYSFELLGEQQVGPNRCFVARATPRRSAKYLFEGKLWIDVDDYAVVRIEGHPARKLSFWIQRADFVRQYQKVRGFWLPQKDQTFVQVRLYGKKVLTIEHQNYAVNARPNKEEWAPAQEARAQSIVETN
jgi:hypothetical protein